MRDVKLDDELLILTLFLVSNVKSVKIDEASGGRSLCRLDFRVREIMGPDTKSEERGFHEN